MVNNTSIEEKIKNYTLTYEEYIDLYIHNKEQLKKLFKNVYQNIENEQMTINNRPETILYIQDVKEPYYNQLNENERIKDNKVYNGGEIYLKMHNLINLSRIPCISMDG